jgi:hypothetical protein
MEQVNGGVQNPQTLICLTDTHKAIAALDDHANYFHIPGMFTPQLCRYEVSYK